MPRRRVVALAVATAILLSGCVATAPVRDPQVIPDGLDRFYGQSLDWQDCESAGLECASVTAPIRRVLRVDVFILFSCYLGFNVRPAAQFSSFTMAV